MSVLNKDALDYRGMQLKVGLEVHQQLATKTKLFCGCPPLSGEEQEAKGSQKIEEVERRFPIQFTRLLRPSSSELGEVDQAARFESRHEIRVRYFADKSTSCLVEADEEPPHPISQDALDTSLIFALALGSKIIDEIHVMRKIVVDGSNTSGFQRTSVVAFGGSLVYNTGKSKVAVQSIGVEEDAARAANIEQRQAESPDRPIQTERAYVLDRLGTPLVEVALAPIEGGTPEEVEDAASSLGKLLRSTGRIARGLGTIRQDLNISIMNGNVIEVKGVQRLEQISKILKFEAARQKFFYDLALELKGKIESSLKTETKDVSNLFQNTQCKIIANAFSKNSETTVIAVLARGLAGSIGKQNEFGSRLGKELGAIARAYGIGGVFHSDELPNYGITLEEISSVRRELSAGDDDAFVLLCGDSTRIRGASEAITDRLRGALTGVPAETRSATIEGETIFLRPRPGAARMYPETDIPLIQITKPRLTELRKQIPEPWDKQVKDFATKYDLPVQLAEPLFDSERRQVFLDVVSNAELPSRFVASVLVDMLQSLSREGVEVDHLDPERLTGAMFALNSGKFAKEALSDLFKLLASEKDLSVDQALAKAGLGSISKSDLEKTVAEVLSESKVLIDQKGMNAKGTIMGKVMQRVRGKADGKLVSQVVQDMMSEMLGARN